MNERIPVSLLTGFLGSGKTTLINALVRQTGWADTAVIVNELGEIGLDHLLVESADDNVVLLDSGCLCCALQGGLKETLADLFVRRVKGSVPRFARVIVETTGIADPGPIANSLVADALLKAEFRLATIATTVDAKHGEKTLETEPEALRQIALADLLLITKTDLVEEISVERLNARLASINPPASRLVATKGDLSPAQLFAPSESNFASKGGALGLWNSGRYTLLGRDHRNGVESVSMVLDGPTTWAGLAAWTTLVAEHFGDTMLRVKGIVEVVDTGYHGPVAIHGIGRYFHPPERLHRWPSDDHRSRLVCIGRKLDQSLLVKTLRAFSLPAGASHQLSLNEL
jgi:G3E family GTPase